MQKISACETLSPEYRKFIYESISSLLSFQEKGIPIGSALGHSIANLALHDLDNQFLNASGIKYFRYVDDIVIVGNDTELLKAKDLLSRHFEAWELDVNDSKTETLLPNQWIVKRREYRELTCIGFEEWKNGLIAYLACHPDEFKVAEKLFKLNSFNLPFKQFKSQIGYSRFRYYLNGLLSKLSSAEIMHFSSCEDALEEGKRIKEKAFVNLQKTLNVDDIKTKTEQNWFQQTIKYLINRALLLSAKAEMEYLLDMTGHISGLENIHDLIRSLVTHDVNYVVSYPGYTMNSFCQLYYSLCDEKPVFNYDSNIDYRPYSLHSLVIYGLIDIDDLNSVQLTGEDYDLLKICAENVLDIDENNFDYINEANSLQKPSIILPNADILNSRFSDLENTVLDSTLLDNFYSY